MVVTNKKTVFSDYVRNVFFKSYITETNLKESKALIAERGYRAVKELKKYRVISLDDLRAITPRACPLYYNFIVAAFNPAVPHSPNFRAHWINAVLMHRDPGKREQKMIKQISMQLRKIEDKTDRIFADSSYYRDSKMRASSVKYYAKLRKSIIRDYGSAMNDHRSFVTVFLYSLLHRANVTYVTADSDFKELFLNFFNSIADQIQFRSESLEHIGDNDELRRIVYNGENLEFRINALKHAKSRMEIFKGIAKEYRPGARTIFKIKHWDVTDSKYREMRIVIDKYDREAYLEFQHQHVCHYAKNSTMGNWLHTRYWWPNGDSDDIDDMKVVLSKKKIINHEDVHVSKKQHDNTCLYVKKDKENDLSFFCSFIDSQNY